MKETLYALRNLQVQKAAASSFFRTFFECLRTMHAHLRLMTPYEWPLGFVVWKGVYVRWAVFMSSKIYYLECGFPSLVRAGPAFNFCVLFHYPFFLGTMRAPPAFCAYVDMHLVVRGLVLYIVCTKKTRHPTVRHPLARTSLRWISTWRGRPVNDILYISMTISM